MKVLAPQKHPPGSWTQKQTCVHCEAQLLVEEEDLVRHVGSDCREGQWDYALAKCIECGCAVEIEPPPPKQVLQRAKKAK